MNTVLITGATGFIGRYVARQFAQTNWSVVGLGTHPPENAPTPDLAAYYPLILPSTELAQVIQQTQPQVCIHCAGRASVDLSVVDPASDFNASVAVTFNVLDTLRIYAPTCRVIYLSSAAVYGNPASLPITETHGANPISPYGFHKLMGEQLCAEFFKLYQLPTTIVRIFSAYGPGLRRQVLWDICRKALTQPTLMLRGTGQESRDFIHVRDIARAIYLLATQAPFEANIYNLASGVETPIEALATIVRRELNCSIPLEFDGIVPLGNPLNWRADMSKLQNLGFVPEVSLARGVQVYAQWCRAEILGW